jgi:Na+-driven multidrug efflux pump
MKLKVEKAISVFLWLVALHSFVVGVCLILLPSSVFVYLGFNPSFDRFFSTQGGVFHIIMSVCYAMGAHDVKKFLALVIFSFIVKFIAAIFLLLYFVLISSQLLIILSCVSDLVMGLIIFILYIKLDKQVYSLGGPHE